jgi:hypothetical protein
MKKLQKSEIFGIVGRFSDPRGRNAAISAQNFANCFALKV